MWIYPMLMRSRYNVDGENIVIKKYCKVEEHKTIQELFAGYVDDFEPTEINWGRPKGREVW
ncbi:AbrB/MazE/SpoVT family DNA-binding domain-containing protein [Acetobacterium woodii]|uniref:AbrB/MazE/SpoVT family DNA-binding domain-containing protein n=1 Tax=Acetobacterium woodii TaxID=33952 RepID=UPI00145E7B37|nr:hypothetical protein [Acetobacterium woodii]